MELSLVAILSSMPMISKLGPISILAVLVVPFLLMIVELYLVFGLLNILTVFSIPIFYIPLNKIAYYFGDIVYELNLRPMYFKIPIYYRVIFDGLLLLSIVFIKDRFLKVFSMIFLFGLAYAMWGVYKRSFSVDVNISNPSSISSFVITRGGSILKTLLAVQFITSPLL